ncbi:MAG: hypothetical protein KJO98_01025 [Rhodothermia bacterium]|nr:hypothetical protein [Rhodothermia bacterium]
MISNLFVVNDADGHSPAVQLLLVLLQASLGFVLVCILGFFIVERGARVSIPSGVGIHAVGFVTTWLLSARIPRLLVIWSFAFAILPLLIMPFAGYRYLAHGFWPPFGFWLAFGLSLLATSGMGGILGVRRKRSKARKRKRPKLQKGKLS